MASPPESTTERFASASDQAMADSGPNLGTGLGTGPVSGQSLGPASHADSEALEDGSFAGLEPELLHELTTFESFFKTFGFKRIHGRVWGLLVLAGQPLTAKEIVTELGISQGAASTTINELVEWGAVSSTFDSGRRSNVHEAVGNTLSIVATVLRRREQVAFDHFKTGATRMLEIIREQHGNKDPRVLTLRSIIATCDLADAVMKLIFTSVSNALGDPQSLLSKAIGTALKVGVGVPARILEGRHHDEHDADPSDDIDGEERNAPGPRRGSLGRIRPRGGPAPGATQPSAPNEGLAPPSQRSGTDPR